MTPNDYLPHEDKMADKSQPLRSLHRTPEEREEETKQHKRDGMNLAVPWTLAVSCAFWCAYTLWNKQTDSDKVGVVHEVRIKSLEDQSVQLRADITSGLTKQDAKTDKILDRLDDLSRRIK